MTDRCPEIPLETTYGTLPTPRKTYWSFIYQWTVHEESSVPFPGLYRYRPMVFLNHIDGFMQKRLNSITDSLELCLFYINQLIDTVLVLIFRQNWNTSTKMYTPFTLRYMLLWFVAGDFFSQFGATSLELIQLYYCPSPVDKSWKRVYVSHK